MYTAFQRQILGERWLDRKTLANINKHSCRVLSPQIFSAQATKNISVQILTPCSLCRIKVLNLGKLMRNIRATELSTTRVFMQCKSVRTRQKACNVLKHMPVNP